MFLVKNKRVLWVALAIVFVGVLFFLKNQTSFQNQSLNQANEQQLAYDGKLISDLVTIDTDQDGVADWEEALWNTDPTKKVSNPDEIEDNLYIEKLKAVKEGNFGDGENKTEENLTQTDKFSRELFSTVAALTQAGVIDQNTVDKLTNSLASQIENPTQNKIYKISELKITTKTDLESVRNYNTAIGELYKKYPLPSKIFAVLEASIKKEEEDVDTSALSKLDPFIKQLKEMVAGMLKMEVPSEFASLHLDILNTFQKIEENLVGIKMIDADPVVTMGAIGQYPTNAALLEETTHKLQKMIGQKFESFQ